MNFKIVLSTIVSFGMVALSSLPALARDVVLRADSANSRVSLRSTPSNNAPALASAPSGNRVQVIVQRPGANGVTWYYVRSSTGAEGWIDAIYTRPVNRGGLGFNDRTETDRSRRYLIQQYEVRLFSERSQVFLNVFDRNRNRTVANGVPVSVISGRDGVTYTGRNVVLFVHNTRDEKTITITR
ncbi:SH3 domain-containing protein [Leptolyngbya sp. FACHB-17]|uniref:SH3 domain-containing protein n=1 Tax=unclassified Leptolyngbya TaxID=2650499 RepID=UPI001681ADD7|nr:SH3 domain-containing protein [Leptolyngbya sp. FACHB-17]MBD2080656.1 SH3 domain-containing protein [Leptolyngbya sp. FACHB-17]